MHSAQLSQPLRKSSVMQVFRFYPPLPFGVKALAEHRVTLIRFCEQACSPSQLPLFAFELFLLNLLNTTTMET